MPSTLPIQAEAPLLVKVTQSNRRVVRNLITTLACLLLALVPTAVSAQAPAPAPAPTPAPASTTDPIFGPNVVIFDPSMDTATMQSQIDSIYDKQKTNQFGSE